MNFPVMICAGLAAGFIGGLLGVGGGVLLVPIFIYLLKMEPHTAVGTSLATIVFTAFAASLRYAGAENVNYKVALTVALFSIVAAVVGAQAAISLPAPLLKRCFSVFLFCVSIYMFVKG